VAAFESFVALLRDIRDRIYPDMEVKHTLVLDAVDQIDADMTTITDAMVTISNSTTTAQTAANNASAYANTALLAKTAAETASSTATAKSTEATNSANSAASSSATATLKASQIQALTAFASTLVAGSSATASYNPTTGVLSLGIPNGAKGDKGDPYSINAYGDLADRSTYDGASAGFSFLAMDIGTIYFKLSSTAGDWSTGFLFGKGDTGDTGMQGYGWIASAGAPDNGDGRNGDLYLNTLNGDVYEKATDVWMLSMNIMPAINDATISGIATWSSSKIDNSITSLIDDASAAALKTWSSSKIKSTIDATDPIDEKISHVGIGSILRDGSGKIQSVTYLNGSVQTITRDVDAQLSGATTTGIDGTTVLLTETIGRTGGLITSYGRA